jgi:UDP-N-acetylmuramyl pentapeptide phosphotransferase/UDP-N-acetylglucosamine-1-phosphate transferase
LLAIAVAGAATGFLPWNFPHAKIFMGDVGSGALGAMLALMAVRVAALGGLIIAAALPLLPFIFDTAVTLVRRIARGERFYTAHRSHFYQRLTILGWSHAEVTLVWSVLALAGAAVSLFWYRAVAVVLVVLCNVAVAIAITIAERRRATA